VIAVCIPTIGKGIRYLEFYIKNLLETAKDPVVIYVSYHTDDDKKALDNSSVRELISDMVMVPRQEKGMFIASTNHSRAINALALIAEEDIVLFSDYDMAFLRYGWDTIIKEKLKENSLFGVPYNTTEFYLNDTKLPWLEGTPAWKYQGIPNLSFMAITREALDLISHDDELTDFGTFLSRGGIPFRIINTIDLSKENHLTIGTLQWLDTGYEIPSQIRKHGLKYEAMEYLNITEQSIFPIDLFKNVNRLVHFESFNLDGEPFLCHYKKGSSKLGRDDNKLMFGIFMKGVNDHLDKARKVS